MIDRKTLRPNQSTWKEALKYYKYHLKESQKNVKHWDRVLKKWKKHPPKKGDMYSRLQDV